MSSRKEIIIKKYIDFQEKIKNVINIDIFPNLEDIDLVDLLLYFNIYFQNNNNYLNTINDLLFLKNIVIDEKELNKIMPIIEKSIDEFKLIQKLI